VTPVAALYALQEIDLALDADRAGIADASSLLDEPEELTDARARLAERQEARHAAERLFNDQEAEADQVAAKIEPLERKLYHGTILNPKELDDLQHDIDSLKRRRSELEDTALSAMDALEGAQAAFAEAERELKELISQHGNDAEEARQRTAALETEVVDLERRRVQQAGEIEAPLIELYERLRANRQGRAVAKVVGGACQGCRISLPMNLIQRARSSNEIVQCSSCERILHVS
jgi:predicted  nucleic acid-binding Zn-ribbon protein